MTELNIDAILRTVNDTSLVSFEKTDKDIDFNISDQDKSLEAKYISRDIYSPN